MSELGNRLKEARLEKGLSLDDLQTVTKIQKRYLIGIEEGNYDIMPGKFYVRAFIKQYAEAVNLEPELLFENYKDDIPAVRSEELPEQLSRVKTRKTISDANPKVFAAIPKVLAVLFVLGALGLAYYFFLQNAGGSNDEASNKKTAQVKLVESEKVKEKQEEQQKAPDKEDEEAVTKEQPKEEAPKQELAAAEANGRKSTYDLKNADKFVVKVVSNGETWLEVKNGKGGSFFRGILRSGTENTQTFDLSKESEAVIVVGRTLDAEIFVNDQKLEYAVKPTEQVRQDITIRYTPAMKQ